MKYLILCLMMAAHPLLAEEIYVSEPHQLLVASWVGTGTLGSKTYYKEISGEHVWKMTLTVHRTIKGPEKKILEFYFEQGFDPSLDTQSERWRCPPYPSVTDKSKVKLFLWPQKIDGKEVYFLGSGQSIIPLKEF